jgi:hypothetical protein
MMAVVPRFGRDGERRCRRSRQCRSANDPGQFIHFASLSRFCFANLTRNIELCFPLAPSNDEPCAAKDAS